MERRGKRRWGTRERGEGESEKGEKAAHRTCGSGPPEGRERERDERER